MYIFFLLTLSLLWCALFYSSLLSISSHLCSLSAHTVGSLTSNLPSIKKCQNHSTYTSDHFWECLTADSCTGWLCDNMHAPNKCWNKLKDIYDAWRCLKNANHTAGSVWQVTNHSATIHLFEGLHLETAWASFSAPSSPSPPSQACSFVSWSCPNMAASLPHCLFATNLVIQCTI